MSKLKRKIGAGLVALALGSALVMGGVATSTPAEAHGYGYRHYRSYAYPYDGYYGYAHYSGSYHDGCY